MKRVVPIVAVVAFCCLGGASTAVAESVRPGAVHSAPTTTTPAPDGYHQISTKKAGLSMAVPDVWVTLDLARKDIDKIFKQLRTKSPQLASALPDNASALVAQGLTFMAMDATSGGDFHDNFNVVLQHQIASLPSPEAAKAALKSFIPDVEAKKTKVAGVRAVETAGTLAVGSTTVHSTSYFVLGKNGLIQITFSGLADGRQDPTVQTMMGSLKLAR